MDQRMPLAEVAAYARRVEALGYDGLNVPEAVHDGLLLAHEALRATTHLKVATSVLVAFPRSPMVVALAAWDLQAASGGRFELGLGTQVRGNIVARYSTEWTAPVPRMREYIQALRAIFACFEQGTPLHFEGEHYRFTRLQPFFNPGPSGHPAPPIYLGAVGPAMTALAGEVADGHMSHPTHSAERVLRELTIPALERGARRAGRSPGEVARMAAGLVATGPTAEAVQQAREQTRELFAFLYSTPAYWPALEIYGSRELGERLHALSREGRWSELAPLIPDELLDTMVPCAPYGEIAALLVDRYRDLATHITFPAPETPDRDEQVRSVIASLRG
jgi:probable F420-dependent oxidoreductase